VSHSRIATTTAAHAVTLAAGVRIDGDFIALLHAQSIEEMSLLGD